MAVPKLANLAVLCAKRGDIAMSIGLAGIVGVHVGEGRRKTTLTAHWCNDEKVAEIIHKLNFGEYAEEKEITK